MRKLIIFSKIVGVLETEFEENEVHVIPITYPFATSHIWWPINQAKEFNIKFDFRSTRTNAILAYTDVITKDGNGFWEVSLLHLTPNLTPCIVDWWIDFFGDTGVCTMRNAWLK